MIRYDFPDNFIDLSNSTINEEKTRIMCNETFRDHCGVVGICCNGNAVKRVGESLIRLQNRGQLSVGLSVLQESGSIAGGVATGLVNANWKLFEVVKGSLAIGHVSQNEPQPFLADSGIGQIALAFNGRIMNNQAIRQAVMGTGQWGGRVLKIAGGEAETLTSLIVQGKDPVDGIRIMAEQAVGSYALVLLHENGVYAVRDPHGIKPLVLGSCSDGWAVASESPALTEIGMELVRDVRPGEVILLDRQGFKIVWQMPTQPPAFCSMEWAFFSRRDAILQGVAVDEARFRMGANLAREDSVEADLVAPIPMSGLGHAPGYHMVSGIPMRDVFLCNSHIGRSSTPLDQAERDRKAARKLSLLPWVFRNKRVIIIDDHIMRGTQTRNLVQRLFAAGAKEVHLRAASPVYIAPCGYGAASSYDELIAPGRSVEEIGRVLGATTLRYLSLEGFVEAIGLPLEQLCTACFTGKCPSLNSKAAS